MTLCWPNFHFVLGKDSIGPALTSDILSFSIYDTRGSGLDLYTILFAIVSGKLRLVVASSIMKVGSSLCSSFE